MLIALIMAVAPVVTFILGIVLITILGSSETLAWNILLAGVAWLTHIAADRVVSYGLRAADGTIRVSSGVL